MEHLIQQYTAHLLKITYLITRDRKKVDEIVQRTFIQYASIKKDISSNHKQKIILLACLQQSLQIYVTSRYYAKLKVKSIFEESDRFSNKAMQDDASYQILKLPYKLREVATLYFYAGLHVSEIAQIMKLPPATITSRIESARKKMGATISKEAENGQANVFEPFLTEWNEYAVYLIEKLLQVDVQQLNGLKPKNVKRKWGFISAIVVVLIISNVQIIGSRLENKKIVDETTTEMEEATTEQTLTPTFYGSNVYPYAIERDGNLYPNEKAIEMSQLEAYYLDEDFPPWAYAERKGTLHIHYDYSAYYHLMKYNYIVDQKAIDQLYERADLSLRTYKERQGVKEFMAILQEKGYTEEEYKLHVLIPSQINSYFERLIYDQKIGDDDYSKSINEYIMIADVALDEEAYELYHDYSLSNDLSQYEKVSYDVLPFHVAGNYYEFGKTVDGSIIILNPNLVSIDFLNRKDAQEQDQFSWYKFEYGLTNPISRLTIHHFIENMKKADNSTLTRPITAEGIEHWIKIMELFETSLQVIK